MYRDLVSVAPEARGRFGTDLVVASHRLHELDLFGDDALADLLDNYPREYLFALTMGTNPEVRENRLAKHEGLSGRDLLRAVKNGRLWLNVTRVNLADKRFRDLIDALYQGITQQCPGFRPSAWQGTLLISSPHALVYYHADGPPTFLWHVRGQKRLWVYPALDERFASRDHLEDIFAGVGHEYLPYDLGYDQHAKCVDLKPGEIASWPQNAPHRVTNLDTFNVSLTTEHFTRESRARARVYTANHFFRTRFGLRLSPDSGVVGTAAKAATFAVAKRAGMVPRGKKKHAVTMRVDPDAPLGCVALDA